MEERKKYVVTRFTKLNTRAVILLNNIRLLLKVLLKHIRKNIRELLLMLLKLILFEYLSMVKVR